MVQSPETANNFGHFRKLIRRPIDAEISAWWRTPLRRSYTKPVTRKLKTGANWLNKFGHSEGTSFSLIKIKNFFFSKVRGKPHLLVSCKPTRKTFSQQLPVFFRADWFRAIVDEIIHHENGATQRARSRRFHNYVTVKSQ